MQDVLFSYKDWKITIQPHIYTPYIIHDCDDDERDYARSIVPQAPMTLMPYTEYIEQMSCQVCGIRPPNEVITIWTFLNWDKISK